MKSAAKNDCTRSLWPKNTPIQNHLDDFNSIITDLESMDVKIEDENKVTSLVVYLPFSYNHFKEILLYSDDDYIVF